MKRGWIGNDRASQTIYLSLVVGHGCQYAKHISATIHITLLENGKMCWCLHLDAFTKCLIAHASKFLYTYLTKVKNSHQGVLLSSFHQFTFVIGSFSWKSLKKGWHPIIFKKRILISLECYTQYITAENHSWAHEHRMSVFDLLPTRIRNTTFWIFYASDYKSQYHQFLEIDIELDEQ